MQGLRLPTIKKSLVNHQVYDWRDSFYFLVGSPSFRWEPGATHFFAGTESTGDLRFSLQPITGVGVPFINPRFGLHNGWWNGNGGLMKGTPTPDHSVVRKSEPHPWEQYALTFTQEICYGAFCRAKGGNHGSSLKDVHGKNRRVVGDGGAYPLSVKKENCEKEPGNYVAFRSEQSANVPAIRAGIR
jgi:hypothetical protein